MGPVLVLASCGKPAVAKAVKESRGLLKKLFGIAAIDMDGQLDLTKIDAKWAIVFGGDGAILSAARRMGERPLPTLTVNFGRLGFLSEVEYGQLPEALERVAAGKVKMRERMRLNAQIGEWQVDALNDVVVTSNVGGRLFHVAARIERHDAVRYAGDGLVIATPTGSTAYSLAAGGPILDPDLQAIVITPLAAHALSQRPIVIPATQEIHLKIRDGDPPGRVIVDGQTIYEITEGERLTVKRSESPFLIMRVGRRSYYSRLRRMLGWGGHPKYSDS